jgi:hypothetical protein
MSVEDLCYSYLAALTSNDLESVRAFFTADAVVISPLYGRRRAHEFYAEVIAHTAKAEATILRIFNSADHSAVAVHFRYIWTFPSGKEVDFECVDIFELAEDRQSFTKLTIIYDTAPLRDEFAPLRSTE